MLCSVVVPVYNHAAFIEEALLTCQQPGVAEIIAIDDGSTDDSASVLNEMKQRIPTLRVLASGGENSGAPARLNQLISTARHETIAVLNSDDGFAEGRIHRMLRRMSSDCQFVAGGVEVFNADGVIRNVLAADLGGFPESAYCRAQGIDISRGGEELIRALLVRNFLLTTSNLVFSKTLFQSIGGFRDYRFVHDWDFSLRALLAGNGCFVDTICTRYRVHARNTIAVQWKTVQEESTRMFRQLLKEHPVIDRIADSRALLTKNSYVSGP